MEAADRDLNSAAAKLSCEIERPRKLVRLYADQHHHTGIRSLDRASQILDPHLPVCLIDCFDADVIIGTKNLALATIQCDAIEAGQRVRRQPTAPPSNNITIIVVMRRLDQNKPEAFACPHWHSVTRNPPKANELRLGGCA